MSDAHDSGHGHEEMGFFRKYLWSTNHKTIGKQFLVTSLVFLFVAGFLALSLRWQLAYPDKPVPVVGKYVFASAAEREAAEKAGPDSPKAKILGSVKPEQFVGLTSVHGLLMIFFVIIPILVGAFGNFLIPLHVGTHDMAFPVLNAASYWVFWLACVIALTGLLIPDPVSGVFNPAAAGWTMYAPLSAVPSSSPGNSTGLTMVLTAAILVGFSTIM
ncbi:MAG: cytochrome c oxidase subunit I, partial [Planctomycetota bacterium]